VSEFRYDINGMRAIAVVVVLLFHFNIPGFSGGFIGVDVFFVLSGFLMTSIIVRGLEREDGTGPGNGAAVFLWRFYVARARRIVPALLVMVGALLAIGWWTLAPVDYDMLGAHGAAALVFLSNVLFWQEAGYFDAASHEKWLLHTWSLSVEWQFYLLLPLVLLLVWRLRPGRSGLMLVVGLGVAASLLASVWLTPLYPNATFFLLPTRAWQMLAGGLIFLTAEKLAVRQGHARWLEMIGLGFIGLSVVLFDADSHWPGANALLPVVGSMLVLMAARQSAWAKLGAVRWLGLSSYSLYLWHWPVFVALVYLERDSVLAIGSGLVLSLLLGGLSYHFIENTSRRWLSHNGMIKAPAMLAVGTLAVAMPALVVHQQQGLAGRLSPAVNVAAAEALNINTRREECHHHQKGFDFSWCTFGGEDIRAIMIGDSHAASVITAFQAAVGGDDTDPGSPGILYSSHSACPTYFGLSPDLFEPTCKAFNTFISHELDALPHSLPVIIVNFGGYTFREEFHELLVDSICKMSEKRAVYILRPIPIMPNNVPRILARKLMIGDDESEIAITLSSHHDRHSKLTEAQDAAAELCNARIIDGVEYLCDDTYCYGSENGRPLYYDDHHLSEYGNRKLVPMFELLFSDSDLQHVP
jgi:peptidoglycan/LPS O-acetylase OafA/YrhL